jgi:2'-5' RNA ligase
MKVFLGIPVAGETGKALSQALCTSLFDMPNIRKVPYQNLHITLFFFGNISEQKQKELQSIFIPLFASRTPFTLTARGIGFFPGEKEPSVIWAGLEPHPELLTLVQKIFAALGEKESRPYIGHITLARLSRTMAPEKVSEIKRVLYNKFWGTVPTDTAHLYESVPSPSGPVYRIIDTLPFEGEEGYG